MKTTILISKGVLLWVTALSILFFIIGFEGCAVQGYWLTLLVWLVVNILLFSICRGTLSYKEAHILSGASWLDNLVKSL